MAAPTITEHSNKSCRTNCACVLPITFRIPISFNLRLARATVVLEKLRQAERKIRNANTKGPNAAESSGLSFKLFELIAFDKEAFLRRVINLKAATFQSSLALFCTARYLLISFSTREAFPASGILKKAASTNHFQSSGAIFDPSAFSWFSKFVMKSNRMLEFNGTSLNTPVTVKGIA